MAILVTSDLHLTDNPDDEYRWNIFEVIRRTPADELLILGDLCDRKDRHSAALVNRLIGELTSLEMPVTILKGNHDEPLHGQPYWSFLSQMGRGEVMFVSEPHERYDQLFLPYSKNPRYDWQEQKLELYDVVFMHQPMDGVLGNNGHRLEVKAEPVLPPGPLYYSGDIHTPQNHHGVEYIGAPHPVRFGDNHLCRMLLLDDDYHILKEIKLDPPRKDVLEIKDVGELLVMQERGDFLPGDQFRVRLHMPLDEAATEWPAAQAAIAAWGRDSGLRLASIEVLVDRPPPLPGEPVQGLRDPKQLLMDYGDVQQLDDSLVALGLELLEETIG